MNNFIGLNGFVWFIGIVEDRNDPLFTGRCRIRIFGWHTEDKSLIPTESLPWAQPIYPSNSTTTTNTPKEGDMVFGFFTDGKNGQFPVYIGAFPGIPTITPDQSKGFVDPRQKNQLDNAPVKPVNRNLNDTNGVLMSLENKTPYPRVKEEPNTGRLASAEITANTVIDFRKNNWVQPDGVGGAKWKEPYPGYNTLYPFSSTMESESGHIIQVDDTPGNERLMFAHRTGTTHEVYNSGTVVDKIVKDNYTIIHGSDFCYVKGKVTLTVDNVANIRIKGKTTIEIDGDVDWKIGGQMNLSVGKGLNIKTGQDVNWDVAGDYQQVIDGAFKSETGDVFENRSGGDISFDGPNVWLNSGHASGASATGIAKPNPYTNPSETQILVEKIKPVSYPEKPIPHNTLIPTTPAIQETPAVTDTAPKPANTDTFIATSNTCFTMAMLTAVAPHTSSSILTSMLPGLNKVCAKYNINTQLRRAHFLAQTAAETGGFTQLTENLNYSAATLMKLWPNRYNTTNVNQYAGNPEAIANKTYADRMGNGNEASGDGWNFRGRGLCQLTGRTNYTRFANAIRMSVNDVITYCTTMDGAIESGAWYWAAANCNKFADANDINGVTKAINGGLIGLDQRTANFNRVYPVA